MTRPDFLRRCLLGGLPLLLASSLFAQENLSFDFVQGDFFMCIEDSVVIIDIQPNPDKSFERIRLIWDDTPGGAVEITDASKLQQTHVYPSRRLTETCNYPIFGFDIGLRFSIELEALYTDGTTENIARKIIYRKPPEPKFDASRETYCVGQPIALNNSTCPGNDLSMRYEWTLPDGTIDTTATTSFIPTEVGEFDIRLRATNDCGSTQVTKKIRVIETPTVEAAPDSNLVAGFADPYRVCLNGEETIKLLGNGTSGTTDESWSVFPTSGVTIERRNRKNTRATFTAPGTYTFTLRGTNTNCGLYTEQSFTVEVLEAEGLELDPQPDACSRLAYTPLPVVDPDTRYFIDGERVRNFPFTMNSRAAPYAIRAEKSTDCGELIAYDTILVTEPVQPALISPAADSEFCPDTARVPIEVSDPGGSWAFSPALIVEGEDAFLDLTAAPGDYTLAYTLGFGDCARELSFSYTITGSQLQVPTDFFICRSAEPQPLSFEPSGGVLSGPGTDAAAYSFDPAELDVGTYTLAYAVDNPTTGCREVGSVLATVVPEPEVKAGPPIELCRSDQIITLADYLPGLTFSPIDAVADFRGRGITDAAAGRYQPSRLEVGETDTVILRYSDSRLVDRCFAEDTLLVRITEIIEANAGADTTICGGSAPFVLGTGQAGSWTGTSITSTGMLDPSALSPGQYTYTLTVGGDICEDRDEVVVTVAAGDGVRLARNRIALCDTASVLTLPATTPSSGGDWSGPLPVSNGTVDLAGAVPDRYVFTYEVTSLPEGCNRDAVTVDLRPQPQLRIVGDSVGCAGGDCVTLAAVGSPADRYVWSGGGQRGDSTTLCAAFATPGTYDIALAGYRIDSVDGSVLCASPPVNRRIDVFETPAPARIAASADSICPGETVDFSLLGGPGPDGQAVDYRWRIGQDTFVGRAPGTYAFPTPVEDTLYQVTLETLGACGNATDTFPLLVRANPVADIGIVYTDPCSGGDLQLTNISTGTLSQSLWETSDGDRFSSFQPPILNPVTGDDPRTLTITLTAGNACATDRTSVEVTVNPTDVNALLSFTDTLLCIGQELVAVDISTPGAATSYVFDDGARLEGDTLRRSFTRAGTYGFTQYAYGCGYDSTRWSVTVRPDPVVRLITPAVACPATPFDYRLETAETNALLWFGDGDSTRLSTGTHAYLTPDTTYALRYRVTDREGCSFDSIARISVVNRPEAVALPVDSACARQPITLNSASVGASSCRWQFGDGEIGDGCSVIHVFRQGGSFAPLLIATNSQGCTDTTQAEVFVRATPDFELQASYDASTCGPAPVQFTFLGDYALASSYRLDPGDGSPPLTDLNPTHFYENSGAMEAILTVGFDGLCYDTAAVTVDRREWPQVSSVVTDERCQPGDELDLDVFTENPRDLISVYGDGYYREGESRYQLSVPDRYVVEVVSPRGCDTSFAVDVAAVVPLMVSVRPDTVIEIGDSIRLLTQLNRARAQVRWTYGNFLQSDTVVSPWAAPTDDTDFVINVSDGPCTASDTVSIGVFVPGTAVYVPNAFSPNGDGHNDRLAVFPRVGVTRITDFRIYNRWGSLVHEQTEGFGLPGSPLNWDGEVGGSRMNSGSFVYSLRYEDVVGVEREEWGTVSVVR
jgi:gliding motility-associated-like protein